MLGTVRQTERATAAASYAVALMQGSILSITTFQKQQSDCRQPPCLSSVIFPDLYNCSLSCLFWLEGRRSTNPLQPSTSVMNSHHQSEATQPAASTSSHSQSPTEAASTTGSGSFRPSTIQDVPTQSASTGAHSCQAPFCLLLYRTFPPPQQVLTVVKSLVLSLCTSDTGLPALLCLSSL